jgi:hypothetical protein
LNPPPPWRRKIRPRRTPSRAANASAETLSAETFPRKRSASKLAWTLCITAAVSDQGS